MDEAMISYRQNIPLKKAGPKVHYRYKKNVRSNGHWTDEEKDKLKKAYMEGVERKNIIDMLPEKSSGAIASMIAKLGLKRP